MVSLGNVDWEKAKEDLLNTQIMQDIDESAAYFPLKNNLWLRYKLKLPLFTIEHEMEKTFFSRNPDPESYALPFYDIIVFLTKGCQFF